MDSWNQWIVRWFGLEEIFKDHLGQPPLSAVKQSLGFQHVNPTAKSSLIVFPGEIKDSGLQSPGWTQEDKLTEELQK